MTPVEKENELVNKMFNCDKFTDDTAMAMLYTHAKQCALIAVDEIINSNPHSNPLNSHLYSTMNYWNYVKDEIEKL